MIKTEGLGKKLIHIYETYKNTVIPHGRHIYSKASIWKRKQCVRIQSQIMRYQTGNVSYDVVPNSQA